MKHKLITLSFVISLIPLAIGAILGAGEYRKANFLQENGIHAEATILETWKTGTRLMRYHTRYEFEGPNGEDSTIHAETITRSHYQALQGQNFLEIRYFSNETLLARSETYSITAISQMVTLITLAGILFLPGLSMLLVNAFNRIGRQRWYAKYILLVPIFGYIAFFIDLIAVAQRQDYTSFFSPMIFLPIGVLLLLIIGDVFKIPWLAGFEHGE